MPDFVFSCILVGEPSQPKKLVRKGTTGGRRRRGPSGLAAKSPNGSFETGLPKKY